MSGGKWAVGSPEVEFSLLVTFLHQHRIGCDSADQIHDFVAALLLAYNCAGEQKRDLLDSPHDAFFMHIWEGIVPILPAPSSRFSSVYVAWLVRPGWKDGSVKGPPRALGSMLLNI